MNNVIVVTSGKGGVGKSTLTAIIGKSLSSYYKVLLIDGDIGLKNLENCLSLDLNNKDIKIIGKFIQQYQSYKKV